jgi:hypothetical protein
MADPFTVPILLITYKRADTTRKVINTLREIRPSAVYFAANAPNPANPADPPLCQEVRDLVNEIDWPCNVTPLFREKHLNARESISSSITWFFENVEAGIILEDDCVCDVSFFHYCAENLERYRNDEEIMQISATNFNPGYEGKGVSYYFSRYALIWGWATWRRAWRHFDLSMRKIDKDSLRNRLQELFPRRQETTFWLAMYDYLKSGKIDTWDGQWVIAVFMNDGLCITPRVNLIQNLGFDATATNTSGTHDVVEQMTAGNLELPLSHPAEKVCDQAADIWVGDNVFKVTRSHRTGHLKLRLATLMPVGLKKFIKRRLYH